VPNNRRNFLKKAMGASALAVLGTGAQAQASGTADNPDQLGVLVDTTRCVGCRKCEKACNEINVDLPRRPEGFFEGKAVFDEQRRMDYAAYTVVNRHEDPADPGDPVYAKMQCMHCLSPGCVSACIVGALSQQPDGAVTYDASKCIGCRYCMVACPFQVPAYEYGNVLTPQVRKCTFCFETRLSKGQMPACVEACPMQVMTFGKRTELVREGHRRIGNRPKHYVDYLYGEHEVGGTSWMYLSSIPFEEVGLPKFGYHPVPGFTEPVQHMLFKWFLPPLALYGSLGGIMWFLGSKGKRAKADSAKEGADE
jgi:formate dehydrogenase iron-sulfur subunit